VRVWVAHGTANLITNNNCQHHNNNCHHRYHHHHHPQLSNHRHANPMTRRSTYLLITGPTPTSTRLFRPPCSPSCRDFTAVSCSYCPYPLLPVRPPTLIPPTHPSPHPLPMAALTCTTSPSYKAHRHCIVARCSGGRCGSGTKRGADGWNQ